MPQQFFLPKTDLADDKIQQEAVTEKLYAQIGQLKVENDWLKKITEVKNSRRTKSHDK